MAEAIGLVSKVKRHGEWTEHMLARGSGLRRSAYFCGHGGVPNDYYTVDEGAFRATVPGARFILSICPAWRRFSQGALP